MGTDHYAEAIRDLKTSYGDTTTDGTALWRATRAQVHAALALVDAIRDLAPKTPEAGDDNSPSAPAPASGPLPGRCACGHNFDVHDEETGECMVCVRFWDEIHKCTCVGFEAS